MLRTRKLCCYMRDFTDAHYSNEANRFGQEKHTLKGVPMDLLVDHIGDKEGKTTSPEKDKIEQELRDLIPEYLAFRSRGIATSPGGDKYIDDQSLGLTAKSRKIVEGSLFMQYAHTFRLWAEAWVSPINFLITLGVGFFIRELYNLIIVPIFHWLMTL